VGDTAEPTVADVVESSTVRPGATTTAPGTTTPDPMVVVLVVVLPGVVVVTTSDVVLPRLVPLTELLTEPLSALLVELLVVVEPLKVLGVVGDVVITEVVEGEVGLVVDPLVALEDGVVACALDVVVSDVVACVCGALVDWANAVDVSASAVKSERLRSLMGTS
jgi:hypothetical protein